MNSKKNKQESVPKYINRYAEKPLDWDKIMAQAVKDLNEQEAREAALQAKRKNNESAAQKQYPSEPVLPKYYLTNDVISFDGRKLHRIVAACDIPEIGVQEGDLGGYIESERNLSHRGTCWVFAGKVYEQATISGGATVRGENIRIHGNASLTDGFTAYDSVHLYDNFRGSGCAKICDYTTARGYVIQTGSSYVGGVSNLSGHVKISGNAYLSSVTAVQTAQFGGNFKAHGGTYINCNAGIVADNKSSNHLGNNNTR